MPAACCTCCHTGAALVPVMLSCAEWFHVRCLLPCRRLQVEQQRVPMAPLLNDRSLDFLKLFFFLMLLLPPAVLFASAALPSASPALLSCSFILSCRFSMLIDCAPHVNPRFRA